MTDTELAILSRAHRLFSGVSAPIPTAPPVPAVTPYGGGPLPYRLAARTQGDVSAAAAQADAVLFGVLAAARADHAAARRQTGDVVEQARADYHVMFDNPLAYREAMRRRAARLRAQRHYLLAADRRALRHRAALRRLRYPGGRHRGQREPAATPGVGSRAGTAVRAALSRLGRPYVWGAGGPDRFDCSGLTQWSYAQAGVHLDRTTYQQIQHGVAVPRSQVRPGDLVFPSADHVQLAIGNNLVVEAPHPGAVVRISALGGQAAIRRPVP